MGERKLKSKERRTKIKQLNRKLSNIQVERKFVWKTSKYQIQHRQLLDSQEETIRRELERIL